MSTVMLRHQCRACGVPAGVECIDECAEGLTALIEVVRQEFGDSHRAPHVHVDRDGFAVTCMGCGDVLHDDNAAPSCVEHPTCVGCDDPVHRPCRGCADVRRDITTDRGDQAAYDHNHDSRAA